MTIPVFAFAQLHANERADSTVAFLYAAVAYYARFGVRIRSVLTDKAPCYYSRATTPQSLPPPASSWASAISALDPTLPRPRITLHTAPPSYILV